MKHKPDRALVWVAALLACACWLVLAGGGLGRAGDEPSAPARADSVAVFAQGADDELAVSQGADDADAALASPPPAGADASPEPDAGTSLFWIEAAPAEPSPAPEASPAPEDTPAAAPSPAPGFRLEVLPAPSRTPGARVLIYHSHTYEAYEQAPGDPYPETEKWRTASAAHNVTRVGAELAALLRGLGFEVTHDATAFEPPDLSGAYARSLIMLEKRAAAGERYDLYIDLHRDAYAASQTGANAVNVGGLEAARLMLLIGKGEGQTARGFDERPDWERNLAWAQAITGALNAQAEGLCKDVRVKSGRFNQHIADRCVLVEAGNNRNTLAQALAAMPYLADAIGAALASPP